MAAAREAVRRGHPSHPTGQISWGTSGVPIEAGNGGCPEPTRKIVELARRKEQEGARGVDSRPGCPAWRIGMTAPAPATQPPLGHFFPKQKARQLAGRLETFRT
jgi:hypothetical protein